MHTINCKASLPKLSKRASYQQFLLLSLSSSSVFQDGQNTDFNSHFATRGGIFPPRKLGGLKILRAGSTASKLLETQHINNVGLDAGFKTHSSTAALIKATQQKQFSLSFSALSWACCLQADPVTDKLESASPFAFHT